MMAIEEQMIKNDEIQKLLREITTIYNPCKSQMHKCNLNLGYYFRRFSTIVPGA